MRKERNQKVEEILHKKRLLLESSEKSEKIEHINIQEKTSICANIAYQFVNHQQASNKKRRKIIAEKESPPTKKLNSSKEKYIY
jgi:hypothetical protein